MVFEDLEVLDVMVKIDTTSWTGWYKSTRLVIQLFDKCSFLI